MTYFKRLTVIMLVVAMILGTAGIAGAAPADVVGQPCEEAVDYLMDLGVVAGYPDGTFQPARTLTRAEVAKIIVLAHLGEQGETLAGYLKGAYSFSDVPADHWASGYIKLAQNLGVIAGYPDGTFKPLNMVTHIELVKMLAIAAGLAPGAGAWPTNWLTPGLAAGIVYAGLGVDEPVTRCQMAMMAHHTIANVVNPATGKTLAQSVFGESLVATLTLAPEASTVAIGAAVQFVATAKDAEGATLTEVAVTYTTDDPAKSAINATGLFVASASGHYTVTAKAGSEEATAMVHVFGAATALKATPETATVPANAKTEVALTVELVDANGILVANDSTTKVMIAYAAEGENGAVDLPKDTVATVAAGKATFKVKATANSEVTDILKFSVAKMVDEVYVADTKYTADTVEVTSVDQTATAIKITAKYAELMANNIDVSGAVTATVVDQVGVAMLTGTYELSLSIVGKGTFSGDTDPINTVANPDVTVPVWSEKGDPGTITVTATGEGLASGSVTITTYIAGSPVALKVFVAEDEATADDEDLLEIEVGLVDKWGHPTIADDGPTTLTFVLPKDSGLTGLAGQIAPDATRSDEINFTGIKAGTWTVTVKADGLTSASFTVTVTPGEIAKLTLLPSMEKYDIYVPVSAPTMTFTAQLADWNSNKISDSGVEIIFHAEGAEGNRGNYKATGDGKVKTDATGLATCTFTFDAYVDDMWYVWVELAEDDEIWAPSYDSYAVIVTDAIAGSINITTKNGEGQNISTIMADEGNWVYVTVSVLDTFGNPMGVTRVEVTFSGKGVNVQNVQLPVDFVHPDGEDPGYYVWPDMESMGDPWFVDGVFTADTAHCGDLVFRFEGMKTGSFTISAKALQTTASVTRSKSFVTKVGQHFEEVQLFLADGTLPTKVVVTKDQPLAMRIAPVDNGGNPIVAACLTKARLGSEYGEFRLTSTGTSIGWDTCIEIPAGKTYTTVYFVAYESDSDGIDLTGSVLCFCQECDD